MTLRPARRALVGVLLVAGCGVTPAIDPSPAAPDPSPVAAAPTPVSTNAERLAALQSAERDSPGPDYDRSLFGSGWHDTDGNGCNQRDDVLLRDAVEGSTTVARQGRCDHDVLAGTWVDPPAGRSCSPT